MPRTKRIGYWQKKKLQKMTHQRRVKYQGLQAAAMQIWDKLCFLIWRTTQKMTMKKPCTTGHNGSLIFESIEYKINPYLFLWLWSVLWSCCSRCFCPQPQENRLNINMSEIVTVGLDFEFREYLNKLKSGSSLYTRYPRVFLWKRQCFCWFIVRNALFW